MDDLARAVALRLEQHRVHGAAGFKTSGPGLHRLGVGHLASRAIHPGVVTHVLPLERQGLLSLTFQDPAEGCCHQGFAGTTGGAEHHQRALHRKHRFKTSCAEASVEVPRSKTPAGAAGLGCRRAVGGRVGLSETCW